MMQEVKEKELEILLEFLTENYVEEHMTAMVKAGVKKLSHLEDVNAKFLENLGMGEIAIKRFLKNIEEVLSPKPSIRILPTSPNPLSITPNSRTIEYKLYHHELNPMIIPLSNFKDITNATYRQLVEAISNESMLSADLTVELYTQEGYPMACNPDACIAKLSEWNLPDYGNILIYAIPRLTVLQHATGYHNTNNIGSDIINIQHSESNYSSSVNVDCEKHTLKFLLRQIEQETGIPYYLISFKYNSYIYSEGSPDQILREIGIEHKKSVLNLIIDTDYWESKWDNNFNFKLCKPTWLSSQSQFGISYFYSILWTISVMYSQSKSQSKKNLLGYIRLLTACPPLVHALTLLFNKFSLSLPHRVAIQEILFLLFSKLQPKCTKEALAKPSINSLEITENSHIFWTYFISRAVEIHGESEEFELYELTCQVSLKKMKEPVSLKHRSGIIQILDRGTVMKMALIENSMNMKLLNDVKRIIRSFPSSDTTALVWKCQSDAAKNSTSIANNITYEEWLSLIELSAKDHQFLIIQSPTKIKDHMWSSFPCIIPTVGKYVCLCLQRAKGRDRKTPIHDVIEGDGSLIDIDEHDMRIKEVGLEWCGTGNANLSAITRDNIRAVTRTPREIILVLLDVSLSMEEPSYHFTDCSEIRKIEMVHRAFLMFADRTKAYNFHHLIGLVPFAATPTLAFPLSESFDAFSRKLENIPLKACTALYDAISFANEAFNQFAVEHPQYIQGVKKRILCLTDGIDHHSHITNEQALQLLIDNDIIMDLILLCEGEDFLCGEGAHHLAKLSGGYSFYPTNETDFNKLLELETLISLQCRKEIIPFFKKGETVDIKCTEFPSCDYEPQYAIPEAAELKVEMSEKCLSRIIQERKLLTEQVWRGKKIHILQQLAYFHQNKDINIPLNVFPCVEDITFWQVLFEGPDNSPYKGGVFRLYVDFEGEYPIKPPKVRFLTPIYHCNINSVGRVCHAILDQFYASNVKVRDILYYVFHLLSDPEPDDPLNAIQADELKHSPDMYYKKATEHTRLFATQKTMTELRIELLGGEEIVDKYKAEATLICPLSLELFQDPVITNTEGLTYERKYIEEYIDENHCDPITRSVLEKSNLVANLAIAKQAGRVRTEFEDLSK
ncbi:hypothetical protein LOD99_726 [Oopsacas minuta]|uniref:non-specific protein-tyrosine kinase n=1 Tax=Oopsacas minuta TaxID=111878 RepID=A0AAV7JZC0_9METZ|nr:hypothetical protein LOD99_726 [Oopsacas minuta]